jgi:pSer/pThr/pTyr-binding forkhead associated (FHA) protein
MAKLSLMLNGKILKEIQLSDRPLSIGRDPGCDIQIDNAAVSRTHAEIYRQGYSFYIEDKKITNGNFLNGKFLNWKSALNHKDRITVGKHALVYTEQGKEKVSIDDASQTVFMTQDELKK